MAERFYLNCKLQPGPVYLDGAEARHLSVVCRARPGDAVVLFNGDGHDYEGRIAEVGRREVSIEIDRAVAIDRELDYTLEVAAPIPKSDRAQFLIEKLTELGVTSFVPLKTERSVIHPRDSKLEKLQRYVVEASKQCRRNVLMEVTALTTWEYFCQTPAEVKLLAHPSGETHDMGKLAARLAGCQRVSIAVGSEGGFTEEEITGAVNAGWIEVDMGARILRIETAAILLAGWVGLLRNISHK